MEKIFFTPGPAQLYPTYKKHLDDAMSLQLGSISHRSKQFRIIYQHTSENLKELLNIPSENSILFTGSATEIWERILQSCVEKTSFHLVNGSFSKKFYDFSIELGKNGIKQEVDLGEGFNYEDIKIPIDAELVCLTHNETSSGVVTAVDTIHQLKKEHIDKLFVVDMVSSAPYPKFDYNLIDSAFFSVQKSFGMPAGLGVWIVNEKCIQKSEEIKNKGHLTGTYHSLISLYKNAKNFETPSTPNVVAIYILGKVVEDMLTRGADLIRQETDEKAKYLYKFLNENENISASVKNNAFQSPTVVVAKVKDATGLLKNLEKQNIIVGSGYGKFKDSQIRIANFPALNISEVDMLVKSIKNYL